MQNDLEDFSLDFFGDLCVQAEEYEPMKIEASQLDEIKRLLTKVNMIEKKITDKIEDLKNQFSKKYVIKERITSEEFMINGKPTKKGVINCKLYVDYNKILSDHYWELVENNLLVYSEKKGIEDTQKAKETIMKYIEMCCPEALLRRKIMMDLEENYPTGIRATQSNIKQLAAKYEIEEEKLRKEIRNIKIKIKKEDIKREY